MVRVSVVLSSSLFFLNSDRSGPKTRKSSIKNSPGRSLITSSTWMLVCSALTLSRLWEDCTIVCLCSGWLRSLTSLGMNYSVRYRLVFFS